MRISELSRRAGVSIPTIKFYLREGLLPPGERTAPRQASYTDDHLQRLRLIRTLTEVGGLSLRDVRSILEALDDGGLPIHELLGVAHYALARPTDPDDDTPDLVEARAEVDRFIAELGWRVSPEAPGRLELARALVGLRGLGREAAARDFAPYARVADEVAAWEVATLPTEGPRAEAVERVVVGTVVFEAVLAALRRLAQEHHSARRFGAG